jgi:hypothetical protein
MTTALRILRTIVLAMWVGSIVFFAFVVARVAFGTLADTHQAGTIVRGCLQELHRIGLIAGVLYFLFTLGLIGLQRDTHPARAIELALIVAMMSLTAYSQFSVIPRMERDRLELGGNVNTTPPTDPVHSHFDRLHSLSEKMEGAVLIEGLILLGLAPIHGRDDMYMFN